MSCLPAPVECCAAVSQPLLQVICLSTHSQQLSLGSRQLQGHTHTSMGTCISSVKG